MTDLLHSIDELCMGGRPNGRPKRLEAPSDSSVNAVRRAVSVAKGEEGGHRCGLGRLALITFGGGAAALATLSIILALGGGQ